MPATKTTPTISIPLSSGESVTVPLRWQGTCLCVHPPVKDGAPNVTPGFWVITDRESGLSAGQFSGSLRQAVMLAKAWDAAFSDAIRRAGGDLSRWQYRHQWHDQLRGLQPPTGPMPLKPEPVLPDLKPPAPRATAADGDGGEQYPATVTVWRAKDDPKRWVCSSVLPDGRSRLRNPETGKPVRMTGDVALFKTTDPLNPELRLYFRGAWHPVPSIAEMMELTFDSICRTPDGDSCEPDAPESWLTLLGLV